MVFKNIIIERIKNTKIITIKRPLSLNALNRETLLELNAAIKELDLKELNSVIITGFGDKSFVAGADLREMEDFTPIEAENFSELGHGVMEKVNSIEIPVIAAVNGFALGGGLELALACDFIYASEVAVFGLVETELALIPGFGGIGRLSRKIGTSLAKEMIFSAKKIKADEALRIGLINNISKKEDLVSDCLGLAERISKNGKYAISMSKKIMNENENSGLRTVNFIEQRCFGLAFGNKDSKNRIKTFLEKRK